MNFDDTPAEAAIRAEAAGWLAQHAPRFEQDDLIAAHFRAVDSFEDYLAIEAADIERAKAWQRELVAGGWGGITWPTSFGGRGGTSLDEQVFAEESARYRVTTMPLMIGLQMVGPTLIAHGTPEQQARHVGAILRAETVWCQLFSEPGAGSDLAAMRTRAEPDGDDWIVNGQKVWTSSAHSADWAILIARSDADLPKHKGITYFIVDMTTPGIDVRPLRQMSGSYHFNEVFLDDVRIPADCVVGAPNQGWAVTHTTLSNERAMIGGAATLKSPPLIELARRLGCADDPHVRLRLVDVHMADELLRFLKLRLRTASSQGRAPGPEALIMKLMFSSRSRLASTASVEIQGASGMLLGGDAPSDGAFQQDFLTSPGLRIGGGTDEIQRNTVAEMALGLPRELRVDKDVPFRDLAAG
jgi:alkylation response protein AidB-like acyl-CoA dehydrogenase